ncbi:hypothetical protein DEIGR_102433 [Deinococcus grandis]|uniref:Uncharacterized protein n=1 Tax=Deinococcus grandis TaxID=57498 RepID=A0A100HKG5_9DEIO|nr:hypothetical protein [Deinococcus grandis]BBN94087.1 hypothetical protein DEGR_08200 [Deinococcus grandis]GAQ22406.1 hypothetical protein DEIGR_102433 [Deinococcus grandis]
MVQTALTALLGALRALLDLALPAALVLAALTLALGGLALIDRDRARRTLGWVVARAPQIGAWGLAAILLGGALVVLNVSRHAVDARIAAQQSARYANAADPDGGQTVQVAPSAALLESRTYTRSLLLPNDVATRIRVDNSLDGLLPYLGNPGETVQDLRENFTRTPAGLRYTREVVMQSERPLDFDRSVVRADLRFVDPAGGRGTYYTAAFQASYRFRNPLNTTATLRFAFPLPGGSGTLSGFTLTVNGQALSASDLLNGSVWEGQVPAGGSVDVQVAYAHQGSRAWSYQLSRREAIRDLDVTVTADRPAKFQRYSLFPTSQTRPALGGPSTLRWQLKNAVTAQDVAVVFTQGSVRETLTKVHLTQGLAVVLAALLIPLWAVTRRTPLAPLTLGGALLGLALGFTLGGVLTAYLPLLPAEILGSLAGAALAWVILGGPRQARTPLLPLLASAALPLAFLTGGHAGLILTVLAATLLLLLLPRARWLAPATA